ncbi:MAG: hypothetical protein LUE11_01330, partial [Clostridia bacterium]|nr:hypothetical protein [Clostridia bacterium]
MKIKDYKSRLGALLLAGTMAATMVPGVAFAADGEVTKTYSGTVHRADGDHFGDYDFTAKFTTVDGVLTSVYFDSDNWNKEINATTYSQDAIDDLLDQLRAQETLNAEGLDNVTGATRSSDGIKAVITEALADEALGIKSVAEDVEVTFNVTDDNKGSGRGEGGGNHGGETTEPVTAEQTYSGSVHRADDDHFGDYDFTAKFT